MSNILGMKVFIMLFLMSAASTVTPPPFIGDTVHLCGPALFLVSGLRAKWLPPHFPLCVLVFLPNVPWSFLIILSALYCFEEEAFTFLSSVFIF